MKHLYCTIIALCLFFAVQESFGQERTFGLGVIVGEPTGLSAKLWTSNSTAFDFGLGWSNGGNQVDFHMGYLWHAWNALRSTERFPLYYGVGGRIITGAAHDASVGVRGVVGIAWMPRGTPIDVFLEVAPSLQLTPNSAFSVTAGFGARYYF